MANYSIGATTETCQHGEPGYDAFVARYGGDSNNDTWVEFWVTADTLAGALVEAAFATQYARKQGLELTVVSVVHENFV